MRPSLSRPTGVGVYLQNLVRGLAHIDQENDYRLFSASWKDRFDDELNAKNFRISDHKWPVRVLNFSWNYLNSPAIEVLVGTSLNVVHSPTPLLIPARSARRVTTVHDLYFYTNPSEAVREMRNIFPRKVKEHSLRADAIIAISDYTKRQLIELLQIPSSRIYTIKHGIDPFFLECASEEEKRATAKKFHLPGRYLLFVGTQEPRKNLPVLVDAFQRMRERDIHLVIAGQPGWDIPPEQFQDERILQTGYVSKAEVRALYQLSLAVVFPSIDEGFGLPLLEGMASRVPIIASRIPAFKEVCNESCAYFEADRPDELAHVLDEVVTSAELRQQLIEKGSQRVKNFSWIETAKKTLELYKSL